MWRGIILLTLLGCTGCLSSPAVGPGATTQQVVNARVQQAKDIRQQVDLATANINVAFNDGVLNKPDYDAAMSISNILYGYCNQLDIAAANDDEVNYNSLILQVEPELFDLALKAAMSEKKTVHFSVK